MCRRCGNDRCPACAADRPHVESMHAQEVRFSFDGLFDKDTDGHRIPKYAPGQAHYEKPQKVEVGQIWKELDYPKLYVVDRVDSDRAWFRGRGVKLWALLRYDSWQYHGNITDDATTGMDGWRLRYDYQKQENAKLRHENGIIVARLNAVEDERTSIRRKLQAALDDYNPTMSIDELVESLVLDLNAEHDRAEQAEEKLSGIMSQVFCGLPNTEPMKTFRWAREIVGGFIEPCSECEHFHDSHGCHCDLHPVRDDWPPRSGHCGAWMARERR